MAERGKSARMGAPTSTRQRLDCTSMMRPTIKSPISGVYLARRGRTESSLLVFWTVPATVATISVLEDAMNVPWPLWVY